MVNFDRVLSSLSEVKSSQSTESIPLEEVQTGSGCGAREGIVLNSDPVHEVSSVRSVKKTKKEKKKKVSSKGTGRRKEGETLSGTCPNAATKECKAQKGEGSGKGCSHKGRKKKVSHIGRFRRQEAAKLVRNYSSTDMAEILGGAVVEKPAGDVSAPVVRGMTVGEGVCTGQANQQDSVEQR